MHALQREDSNDSFSSAPAARQMKAGGSKRVGGRQAASAGSGRTFGAARRVCKLGALHRHYQALCQQVGIGIELRVQRDGWGA